MKRFGALALLLLCAACHKAPEAPTAQAPASASPAVKLSPDQAKFVGLITAVKADPKDEGAYNAFCAAFENTKTFENWDATVVDSRISTVNNSVDITFDIGGHVRLEQVVQTTDPVYAAIANLNGRTAVRISGSFPHRDGSSECGYYTGTFTIALTKVQ